MKRKVNLLVVFLLIATLMLCVTMVPKAQATGNLPPLPKDLTSFIKKNYKNFDYSASVVSCQAHECKELEIICGKSILKRVDKLNGITDKYVIIYSVIQYDKFDKKNYENFLKARFEKKGGTWSVSYIETITDAGLCKYPDLLE